jgi:hypothetical protein
MFPIGSVTTRATTSLGPPHQEIARPMQHHGALLLDALDRHKRIDGRVTASQIAAASAAAKTRATILLPIARGGGGVHVTLHCRRSAK